MIYQKRLPFNDSDIMTEPLQLDSSGRARREIKFWLNRAKPEEDEMGYRLEQLKTQRSFATFIKNAIRLMFALREGDLSVLMELFPSAVEQIKAEARAEIAQAQKDPSEAVRQFENLFDEIANLKDMIANQPAAPMQRAPEPASVGLKPLGGMGLKPLGSAKPLAAPVFDEDDDDLVVQKAEGNSDAAMNFINSMLALQKK